MPMYMNAFLPRLNDVCAQEVPSTLPSSARARSHIACVGSFVAGTGVSSCSVCAGCAPASVELGQHQAGPPPGLRPMYMPAREVLRIHGDRAADARRSRGPASCRAKLERRTRSLGCVARRRRSGGGCPSLTRPASCRAKLERRTRSLGCVARRRRSGRRMPLAHAAGVLPCQVRSGAPAARSPR